MKLIEDQKAFESLQNYFAQAIALTIKRELEGRKLNPEMIKDITSDLTFSICALIDGSSQFETDEGVLEPVLTFKKSDDELIFSGDSSYMHDTVYGWVYDLFE